VVRHDPPDQRGPPVPQRLYTGFGATEAAVALVGTGAHNPRLVREAMSRWTMMLDVESHLANNPGGEARKMLDDLPYFEYSRPASFVHA
jgi:hypothetical protein